MTISENNFCLVKTPMRVSLSGGGTDFPELFSDIKFGSVLSFAINFYVYTSVRRLDPTFHKNYRIDYSSNELTKTVNEIKNNIVRGVLHKLDWNEIIQVNVISDIPGGSGLGGSSVFCVSLIHALNQLRGVKVSPNLLAKNSNEVELEILGRPMGIQDALPAAFGGLCHYRLHSLTNIEIKQLTNPVLTKYINDNIYLIWTGEHRDSESILQGQLASMKNHLDLYLRLRDITEYAVTKLNKEKNIEEIHTILENTINACHEIKISIANGIVSEYAKYIIDKLESIKVNGYRVVGAGNGGFVLALVHPNKKKEFKQKFLENEYIKPLISELGSHVQYLN